jgi:hypothetical protein
VLSPARLLLLLQLTVNHGGTGWDEVQVESFEVDVASGVARPAALGSVEERRKSPVDETAG